jgi:hypothetical protein
MSFLRSTGYTAFEKTKKSKNRPSLKSISGILGTIGVSVGEGLSPLDDLSCFDVF